MADVVARALAVLSAIAAIAVAARFYAGHLLSPTVRLLLLAGLAITSALVLLTAAIGEWLACAMCGLSATGEAVLFVAAVRGRRKLVRVEAEERHAAIVAALPDGDRAWVRAQMERATSGLADPAEARRG